VDLFFSPTRTDRPLEEQQVKMSILISGKIVYQPNSQHTVHVELLRPDGDVTRIGEPLTGTFESGQPSAPGGFVIVAEIGVLPRQFGIHYFRVLMDGEEVAREPFTLLERKLEQNSQYPK
jgi:hypothetical protein